MSERIKIDDTYTYAYDNGHVQLLRNGLPWLGEEPGGFAGSKAWISAANEIVSLRAKVGELEATAAQTKTPPEQSKERLPSEAENERIEDATERLRHYGYGHLAEAVERLAEAWADECAKRPHREQIEQAVIREVESWRQTGPEGVPDQVTAVTDAVLKALALEPEARTVVRRNRWQDGSYQEVYSDGSSGPWVPAPRPARSIS